MRNILKYAAIVAVLTVPACAETLTFPTRCAFGTTAGTCLQGAGDLGTPSAGNRANLTNSSLTAGRFIFSTTNGVETDNTLYGADFAHNEIVLTGAGSDTIVAGPGLSFNTGSGDVQHFQLGASNQLILFGNPSAWQQNMTVSLSGAVGLPHLASSSAAQTGAVCWTTATGNLTVDTTTTCLLSLEEDKDIRGGISALGALYTEMHLKPFWFSYKHGRTETDFRVHAGMGAHQVEGVDKRLVGYDPHGKLQGIRYADSITSLTVSAVQGLQEEIFLLIFCIGGLVLWNVSLSRKIAALRKS